MGMFAIWRGEYVTLRKFWYEAEKALLFLIKILASWKALTYIRRGIQAPYSMSRSRGTTTPTTQKD